MPPQPRPHLTPQQQQAVKLQASGVTQKEVARRVGVSVRTVESWQTKKLYKECLNSLSGQIGLATAPISSPKPVGVEVLEPYNVSEATKNLKGLSPYNLAMEALQAIIINPDSRESSRIQASVALVRCLQIGQDLPKHIREGQEVSSMEEERKKLESLSPEEIAAEYKYLMSQEYRIAELEKKSPKDAIATIRIEKREAEKLEGLSAEELMRLYKEEIANNGR
jgi:transcriptional regulator with XRE-family HTH domain